MLTAKQERSAARSDRRMCRNWFLINSNYMRYFMEIADGRKKQRYLALKSVKITALFPKS